jgi:hypothetical protein
MIITSLDRQSDQHFSSSVQCAQAIETKLKATFLRNNNIFLVKIKYTSYVTPNRPVRPATTAGDTHLPRQVDKNTFLFLF